VEEKVIPPKSCTPFIKLSDGKSRHLVLDRFFTFLFNQEWFIASSFAPKWAESLYPAQRTEKFNAPGTKNDTCACLYYFKLSPSDQIGRIFAYWVVVYIGQFYEIIELVQIFLLLFSTVKIMHNKMPSGNTESNPKDDTS
jgi:hypothetical protein